MSTAVAGTIQNVSKSKEQQQIHVNHMPCNPIIYFLYVTLFDILIYLPKAGYTFSEYLLENKDCTGHFNLLLDQLEDLLSSATYRPRFSLFCTVTYYVFSFVDLFYLCFIRVRF